MTREPVACVLCGIVRGNSAGEAVYRYPLIRPVRVDGRGTTRSIGSIALCDGCIRRYARRRRDDAA